MTDYAKLGTLTLLHRAAARKGLRVSPTSNQLVGPWAGGNTSMTGWSQPSFTYELMRSIDPGARELNALVQANVVNTTWKASWNAWFANWTKFFDKYQSDFAKLGAIFDTDGLAQTARNYRDSYLSFRNDYINHQVDASGKPLPPPVTPPPGPLGSQENKDEGGDGWGLKIPWWVWVIGGGVLVVGGYYLVKTAKEQFGDLRAKKRALEGTLPRFLGPDLGNAAQAHASPSSDPNPIVSGDPVMAARDAARNRHAAKDLAPSEIFVEKPIIVIQADAEIDGIERDAQAERDHQSRYQSRYARPKAAAAPWEDE